eukprot:SAG31_NODE_6916_length_1851_cov_1.476598_1_plen_425_part_00
MRAKQAASGETEVSNDEVDSAPIDDGKLAAFSENLVSSSLVNSAFDAGLSQVREATSDAALNQMPDSAIEWMMENQMENARRHENEVRKAADGVSLPPIRLVNLDPSMLEPLEPRGTGAKAVQSARQAVASQPLNEEHSSRPGSAPSKGNSAKEAPAYAPWRRPHPGSGSLGSSGVLSMSRKKRSAPKTYQGHSSTYMERHKNADALPFIETGTRKRAVVGATKQSVAPSRFRKADAAEEQQQQQLSPRTTTVAQEPSAEALVARVEPGISDDTAETALFDKKVHALLQRTDLGDPSQEVVAEALRAQGGHAGKAAIQLAKAHRDATGDSAARRLVLLEISFDAWVNKTEQSMIKRQNNLKSTLHFMQLKLVRAWASWISVHQLLKLGQDLSYSDSESGLEEPEVEPELEVEVAGALNGSPRNG